MKATCRTPTALGILALPALLFSSALHQVILAQERPPIIDMHLHADLPPGKRLMFGSDQMRWPQKIGEGIEAIRQAPFLTDEQKRDILFNNAARFLRVDNMVATK